MTARPTARSGIDNGDMMSSDIARGEPMKETATLERRTRVYTLRFDDGSPDERIEAPGPADAVAARKADRLPMTIVDETAMVAWMRRMSGAGWRDPING